MIWRMPSIEGAKSQGGPDQQTAITWSGARRVEDRAGGKAAISVSARPARLHRQRTTISNLGGAFAGGVDSILSIATVPPVAGGVSPERGIGAFVLSAGNLYDSDNLLAGIVVLSLLGLAVSWLIGRVERLRLSSR